MNLLPEIIITKSLKPKKPEPQELKFGMVVRVKERICLIVNNDSDYPILLISLDHFAYFSEFEDFTEMLKAIDEIEILGKLTL